MVHDKDLILITAKTVTTAKAVHEMVHCSGFISADLEPITIMSKEPLRINIGAKIC